MPNRPVSKSPPRSGCYAEIDLCALAHNLRQVQSLAPASRVLAMVKANAYGHGLLTVARILLNQGASALGIARFDEALALRSDGIDAPLLLLGSQLTAEQWQWCARHSVAVSVHSVDMANSCLNSKAAPQLEIWLKFDCGMHRLGMNRKDFIKAQQALSGQARKLVHMSHFSSADSDQALSRQQLQDFLHCAHSAGNEELSMANSAAILSLPSSHLDWVRPGIMLYGDDPLAGDAGLKAVMRLHAPVVAMRKLSAGEAVGYGGEWTARRDSLIATLAIGYGDGYPRSLGNCGEVIIAGRRAPVVGRVSMDLISIDVSELPEPPQTGDYAQLWGNDLAVAEVAARAGTISYELLSGVADRVPRFYSED